MVAVLGCALVCLQQQSYAEKIPHGEYAKMAIKECNDCHKGEGIAPNHDADFLRGHRVLAVKAGNNCNQCHQQKWCLDCHQGGGTGDDLGQSNFGRDYKPKSHRSDFISIHPIKALDNPQQCYRCHEAGSFCNSCHSRFPKGSLRIKSHLMLGTNGQTVNWAIGEHATEARRNLQSCQTCHPEGDVCIKCHSSGKTRPHPRNWKAGNFRDRSNGKVCQKCHLPGTF
ncbi:MAG: cytochrome C [Geobacter sp.]|nr:MAG: cytochrome C [Geobacter sp.]